MGTKGWLAGVLFLLLLSGCGVRHEVQHHTLVRDSVTVRAADTASLVWRYEIETTYISDTLRRVVERGDVVGTRRQTVQVDSVLVVRRDTVTIGAPAVPPEELNRRSRRESRTAWLLGGVVVVFGLFGAGYLVRGLRR
ncbi:MAG: hypothetical protein PUK60_01885 [Bacteroidales bacterium]|nr:hypothetical protein [Bacteroidales bacterium]